MCITDFHPCSNLKQSSKSKLAKMASSYFLLNVLFNQVGQLRTPLFNQVGQLRTPLFNQVGQLRTPLFNQVGQLRTSSHLQLRPGQDRA
jgi:hypothetical protein